MAQSSSLPVPVESTPDRLTLIAISALAYITAAGLHEHLGHTLACILLGSHPTEIGAFYVNCDYTGMSDLSIRLVALAGPLVSLLLGLVSFSILRRRPPRSYAVYYFVWLLGSIALMAATTSASCPNIAETVSARACCCTRWLVFVNMASGASISR